MQHRLRPARMPGPVLAIFGCTTQTPVRSPFTRSRFRSKPSSQRSISAIGDLSNWLWQPSYPNFREARLWIVSVLPTIRTSVAVLTACGASLDSGTEKMVW